MDNWEHRSANMKCQTCMWYVEKYRPIAEAKTGQETIVPCQQIGRCRKHAPTMSGYPAVFETDWCGDHKLDETKI